MQFFCRIFLEFSFPRFFFIAKIVFTYLSQLIHKLKKMSSSSLSYSEYPSNDSGLNTLSIIPITGLGLHRSTIYHPIPIDYKLFQFVYDQFLIWIETQTDKMELFQTISNIWMVSNVDFHDMMISYLKNVYDFEHPYHYLPSITLFDQCQMEYLSTSRFDLNHWLISYNDTFRQKIQDMVYAQKWVQYLKIMPTTLSPPSTPPSIKKQMLRVKKIKLDMKEPLMTEEHRRNMKELEKRNRIVKNRFMKLMNSKL